MEKTYTLELTEEEMLAARLVFAYVGGQESNTWRKHTASVSDKMSAALGFDTWGLFSRAEMIAALEDQRISGSIEFSTRKG